MKLHELIPKTQRHIFTEGESLSFGSAGNERVHFIVEGLVIDTRQDTSQSHHLVNISGSGSLVGFHTDPDRSEHQPQSTAVLTTITTSASKDRLVEAIGTYPELGAYMVQEMARRTQVAQDLIKAAAPQGTKQHLFSILSVLNDHVAGYESSEPPTLPIPLLERVCGCPWVMIRQSLRELTQEGLVELHNGGVRMKQLV